MARKELGEKTKDQIHQVGIGDPSADLGLSSVVITVCSVFECRVLSIEKKVDQPAHCTHIDTQANHGVKAIGKLSCV